MGKRTVVTCRIICCVCSLDEIAWIICVAVDEVRRAWEVWLTTFLVFSHLFWLSPCCLYEHGGSHKVRDILVSPFGSSNGTFSCKPFRRRHSHAESCWYLLWLMLRRFCVVCIYVTGMYLRSKASSFACLVWKRRRREINRQGCGWKRNGARTWPLQMLRGSRGRLLDVIWAAWIRSKFLQLVRWLCVYVRLYYLMLVYMERSFSV